MHLNRNGVNNKMWEYQHPDELYHWKYIKKVRLPNSNGKNKYRYYYSWDEINKDIKNNVIKKEDVSNTTEPKSNTNFSIIDSIKNSFAKVSNISSEVINKGKESIEKMISNAKETVDRTIDNAKETIDRTVENTKKKIDDTEKVIDKTIEDTKDNLKTKVDDTKKQVKDATVGKALETYDKVEKAFNDPDNIYDIAFWNYEQKIKDVENSKEWQDIVKRKDPEYVRKNADGTTSYLLDDYLVKKKHPGLDVIDDLFNGRKVTVNEVDAQTFVAGTKDYISLGGAAAVGISEVLKALVKAYQGSYNDDIEEVRNTASNVKTAVDTATNSYAGKIYNEYNKYVNTSDATTYKDTATAINNIAKNVSKASGVSDTDYTKLASSVAKAAEKSPEVQRLVNSGDYDKAAEVISKIAAEAINGDAESTVSTIIKASKESPEMQRLVSNGNEYVTDTLRRYES